MWKNCENINPATYIPIIAMLANAVRFIIAHCMLSINFAAEIIPLIKRKGAGMCR